MNKHKQLSIFDLFPQDEQVRDKAKTHLIPLPKIPVISKIRAISIHAPHAYAICLGLKPYEFRNSPTKFRGWVLIHSSGSKSSDSYFKEYELEDIKHLVSRQALIGAAFLSDCQKMEGCYGYLFSEVLLFDNPVEGVKGCQSIFWGDCNDPAKIKAFEQAREELKAFDISL
ncbi:MAG: hypothetical protein ACOVOV_19630 [Dolichospermum sp.]|jgi:hypothetical protein